MTGALVSDRRPPRWYAHPFNRVAVYRVAAVLAAGLPRPLRLRAAQAIAAAAASRFPRERAAVRRNLARIVPEAGAAALDGLVREVFRHFAVCFADLVTSNRRAGADDLVAGVDGAPHLAAAADRGVVVLTAHLGNWELAGRLLPARSGRPVHVVMAPEIDPAVERFLRGQAAGPVRYVTPTAPTASLKLVSALRRGEIVALQGDRALGGRADVTHPFFGAPAPFPVGPFVLARAAGATVLPVFCLLGADGRYTITLREPWRVTPGGETAALARWVGLLEEAVRRHPSQWFTFYEPWSAA